jgi:branched-chain amino acid transport system permease protein
MTFFAIQCLNGLSYASTLFLMAAGLTLIFGVTRIVNFAHGSFFMLGALLAAHWVVDWFPAWGDSALLYGCAMLIGAACAGLVGAVAEYLLLRRLYGVPELYQLVATFGLSLAMHDGMRWIFGPQEVFAPRFPGLKESVHLLGEYVPQYELLTIAMGPLVWGCLHLLLHRTRFGQRLRAATQDRAMLSALGVNPKPLTLAAVVLACVLAGLGGALQLPREPASLQMDVNVVVETFVVVVTGGLGSIAGAFFSALLIGLIHAFGTAMFPQSTLIIVFLTMAAVLAVRPHGLLGKPLVPGAQEVPQKFILSPAKRSWKVMTYLLVFLVFVVLGLSGDYAQSLAADALDLMLFGLSLQVMMALGGLVSFGHAAFFALGAYAVALSHTVWGFSLLPALAVGGTVALVVAAVFGALVVRSSGVYLAMLSLALAQVVWAMASQWVDLTGGDNGVIGLNLVTEQAHSAFYLLLLALALLGIWALGRLSQSSFGAALQAVRDAPMRSAASGLPNGWIKYRIFIFSSVLAGLAGGLAAANRGSVFPSLAAVPTSLDALLVVLLGGFHQQWAVLAGSAVMVGVGAGLGRNFDYWRGALGLFVMVIMVLAPSGLLGLFRKR